MSFEGCTLSRAQLNKLAKTEIHFLNKDINVNTH